MKQFHKQNNIIGIAVFIFSTIVYLLTVEETASFWDCGEFIAVSYKLMVPHPPGAPFFLLINRFFSFFAFGDVENIAYWVNIQSVISSGLTIMFLYWSIVFLARKIIKTDEKSEYSQSQQYSLFASGIIGALAYTFSDSFWFSATEAEVYAMSSFFTAFIFWAILKWEHIEDENRALRWLIMIALTIGLSIGVHLLNLVAIPALSLIYYYKKYPSGKRSYLSILAGLLIIGVIMVVVITGLAAIGGKFELFFVNGLSLPFGSGIIFLVLLIVAGLAFGIYRSHKKNNVLINHLLLSLSFILIGYSSYTLIIIRANFSPPINQNDPKDAVSFLSYLKREQYGDRPLIYGPTFVAEHTDVKKTDPVYRKGKDRYEIKDYKQKAVYDGGNQMLLPRIYSQQGGHPELYRKWIGLSPGDKPNMIDNIYYMFRYQFGHMYLRYFMWNFAGRESDERDAGWLTPWSDLGEDIPEELERNKARNNFYFLPLLLGLLGIFYQYSKDRKNFWMLLLLFFLTGLGLVLYLNSPPVEPRERDYIYVGSFYVFAIWIGLGCMSLIAFFQKTMKWGSALTLGFTLSLSVPVIMMAKGWDNHDRSNRYHSVDQARNTLSSCAPNAILFTGGDNDTFPLWYLQNVEGYRTDVRVIVLSYFNTDWYLEQMRQKQYESEPLSFTIDQENYLTGKNDYIPLLAEDKASGGVNAKAYIKLVNQNDPRVQVPLQDGTRTARLLSNRFALNIDKEQVIKQGFVPKEMEDQIPEKLVWQIREGKRAIFKNELALIDLIATNEDWSRPIYFNNTSANSLSMDLRPYMMLEGTAYRLMPVMPKELDEMGMGGVNIEEMLKNIEKFKFRGFDDPGTYNDDEYRKFGANTRHSFYKLADVLYKKGDKEKAIEILNMGLEKIPDYTIPYSFFIPRYIELYHKLGEHEKADQIANLVARRAVENIDYITRNQNDIEELRQKSMMILQSLSSLYRELGSERDIDAILGLDSLSESDSLDTIHNDSIAYPYEEKALEYYKMFEDAIGKLQAWSEES